jgi:hypothetical protein
MTTDKIKQLAIQCGIRIDNVLNHVEPEQIYAFATALLAESKRDRWISVDESIPPCMRGCFSSENVMAVCDGFVGIYNVDYSNDEGYIWAIASRYGMSDIHNVECESDDNYDVTHWMPLPKRPAISNDTKDNKE